MLFFFFFFAFFSLGAVGVSRPDDPGVSSTGVEAPLALAGFESPAFLFFFFFFGLLVSLGVSDLDSMARKVGVDMSKGMSG